MGPALARKYAVIPRVFARGTTNKSFVIIELIEIDMTQRSAFGHAKPKAVRAAKL